MLTMERGIQDGLLTITYNAVLLERPLVIIVVWRQAIITEKLCGSQYETLVLRSSTKKNREKSAVKCSRGIESKMHFTYL